MQYNNMPKEYTQGEVYDSCLCGRPWRKYQTDPPISTYSNSYRFIKNDVVYTGVSYSYSKCPIPKGTIVTIEYPIGLPTVSNIKDMKNTPYYYYYELNLPWIMLIGFLIAFGILIYNIRISFNWIKLLKTGVLGYGKLEEDKYLSGISSLPGVLRGQKELESGYILIFRYQGLNRLTYRLKVYTTEPDLLQDEELEQLIYDPANPSNAVMLDTIPGGIIIDSEGNICPNNTSVSFYFMVIPLAVTMVAAYVILKYVL